MPMKLNLICKDKVWDFSKTEIEIHDINIWIIFVYILLCFVKGFRF